MFPLRPVNYLDLFKACLVCESEMLHQILILRPNRGIRKVAAGALLKMLTLEKRQATLSNIIFISILMFCFSLLLFSAYLFLTASFVEKEKNQGHSPNTGRDLDRGRPARTLWLT